MRMFKQMLEKISSLDLLAKPIVYYVQSLIKSLDPP